MAGKAIALATEIVLGDMLAVITREQAYSLPASEYNRNGVVLVNERVKVFLPDENGVAREFTASLYLQRVPLTDDEQAQVNATAAQREANARAKKAEETERLAREKRAAFELGQESTMSALKNIGALTTAAQALTKLA